MMPPVTWLQRLRRQLFPRHEQRDCCHYHGQDYHAIAALVNSAYRQLRRSDLYGDDLDELRYQLVREARLGDDERTTALLAAGRALRHSDPTACRRAALDLR
jgi:hypothetical protein